MMKNYTLKLCMLLMSMYAFNATAQVLNGVYTLDNTIPASATNFTSFTQLAARINTAGVSGPVTINVGVTSGPYTEQPVFIQAPGISATNTVTINGNGRTITFGATTSTSLHTIMLSGADYMTFNDLTITNTGTTYALTVHLWNQSNNNQFINCRISAPQAISSTNIVPYSLSGSASSSQSSGDHGNNNVVNTCTISGGYYGVSYYGLTSSPYNLDNKIINSYIVDWYSIGFYELYDRQWTLKGNVFERLNLTSSTTAYGIQAQVTAPNSLIEGNHFRKFFEAQQTNGNSCYVIYNTGGGSAGQEMIIRNNIISDMKFNGPLYAMYMGGGSYYNVDHNTISLDDPNSTYTGQVIGIMFYSSYNKFRNNIISIKRGATANTQRIGYYCASLSYLTGTESKNNVFNISGTSGTNYMAYFISSYLPSLNNWQMATNQDWNSFFTDPGFTNPTAMNYLPTSLLINNTAPPVGVTNDFTGAARSNVMPDPGALEFYTTPCTSGPPAANIAVPSTSICPGNTVALVLGSSSFTNTGYSVQWFSSTVSATSGFNSVPNGTANILNTPPAGINTYYTAVVTCTSSTQTSTMNTGGVLIAPSYTSSVPYYESFESLAYNVLPNCSWSATQGNTWPNATAATVLQTNNRVPRTGNGYAIFTGTPAAVTNYFYSNGVWMVPGITYSASMWYINEVVNYNPWADISMLIGPNQSTTGQQLLASSNGPASSVLYSSLSNTFMVSSPAFYYISVKATSATGNSPYMAWDDLSITMPCSLNQPQISIQASNDTICAGQSVNLTVNGTASSYTWNTGANTSVITITPNMSSWYSVSGSNSLTGCSANANQYIEVNNPPIVSAMAFPVNVCSGSLVNLTAIAANVTSLLWNTGATGPNTIAMPLNNTIYTVTAFNAFNCTSQATVQVNTYAKPAVTMTLSRPSICKGEAVTLSGGGASTYTWASQTSGSTWQGATVTDYPTSSTVYSVTGTDANGCVNNALQALPVESCSGLMASSLAGLKVFPNPAHDAVFIEVPDGKLKTIELTDITGRVLYTGISNNKRSEIRLDNFANGIYYLRLSSENSAEVIKIVKD